MSEKQQSISQLKNLGPKSAQMLNEIGVYTREDLEQLGPVKAFLVMEQLCSVKPSLNFLYAMVGALKEIHWQEVVKNEKSELLAELESCRAMELEFRKSM